MVCLVVVDTSVSLARCFPCGTSRGDVLLEGARRLSKALATQSRKVAVVSSGLTHQVRFVWGACSDDLPHNPCLSFI